MSAPVADLHAASDGDLLHLFECYGSAGLNNCLSEMHNFKVRFVAALTARTPAAPVAAAKPAGELTYEQSAAIGQAYGVSSEAVALIVKAALAVISP